MKPQSPQNLVVEGGCRTEQFVWEGPNYGTCERGTQGCVARHSIRQNGTSCTRCGGNGGHYVCPESDRVQFACSNYSGSYQ